MPRFDVHFEFKGKAPKKPDIVGLLSQYADKVRVFRQTGRETTILAAGFLEKKERNINLALKKEPEVAGYSGGRFIKATIKRVDLEDEEAT